MATRTKYLIGYITLITFVTFMLTNSVDVKSSSPSKNLIMKWDGVFTEKEKGKIISFILDRKNRFYLFEGATIDAHKYTTSREIRSILCGPKEGGYAVWVLDRNFNQVYISKTFIEAYGIRILIGDLTGDGRPELVLQPYGEGFRGLVVLQDAGKTFEEKFSLPAFFDASDDMSVRFRDVDKDGLPEIELIEEAYTFDKYGNALDKFKKGTVIDYTDGSFKIIASGL